MAGPWEEFAQNSETESGPWADFSTNQKPKKQDNALVRGLTQANSARKTFGALTTGDYESAAKLAAERDAYQRANPGTPEGNELMAAWEKGDGVIGGIKGVAGEFAKDWREAPTGIAALQATGKNLSAMGGGIVEQIPNMVMPMAGMLAGGAAGSLAGPVGTVGGAFAGAATGNTAAESAEQVDRAIRGAGINPQDTNAVRSFLEQDAGGVLGKSAIKGGIIGAVDTATMGIGGKMLRAPVNAATDRAIASLGINAADKAAVSAAREQIGARVLADPIYQASQKGVQALARNATVGALEPVGEFAGEYLGQGAATGDWDTKGAMLEALSSLGQSGITYAGQKIYQAATSPLRGIKEDNQTAPQETPTVPPGVSLTADPVPVKQRIDAMLGLDTARMDEKGRALYQQDLSAAFNEPIGIRLDANQNEVPYTMGEYLDSQIKIADNERAKPMRSSANQQASTRLNQIADEEAQQHAAITQDLVQSASQGGALSKAALTGIQTGATRMPAHPERAAIEQQMLADEAAQRELAPIQRLMQSRTDEQVQRIANNEKATQNMRQAAVAEIQRRMTTQAQPTTTSPLQQTATQFNLPENALAAQPAQMDAQAPQANGAQARVEQGATPQGEGITGKRMRIGDSAKEMTVEEAKAHHDWLLQQSREYRKAEQEAKTQFERDASKKAAIRYASSARQFFKDLYAAIDSYPDWSGVKRDPSEYAGEQNDLRMQAVQAGQVSQKAPGVPIQEAGKSEIQMQPSPVSSFTGQGNVESASQQAAAGLPDATAGGSRSAPVASGRGKENPSRHQIDPAKDTLFQAIAKLGGMDTQELTGNGFDQKDISVRHNGRVIQSGKNKGQLTKPSFKSRSFGFNMPLHKKGGMSFDGMLEALKQHGYFPEGATKNDAIEAFRRELGGDAVMTPDAAMQQAEMQAEQEENDAIGYDDLSDREKALVDFHAENIYDEDSPIEAFKRGMKRDGATEDEINEAIKQTFGTQETGNNDSGGTPQGTGEARDAQGAWNGSQDGQVQESAEPDWLTGQTNEQAAEQFAQQKAAKDKEAADKKAADAKSKADSEANDFRLAGSDRAADVAVAGGQQDIFAQQKQASEPAKSNGEDWLTELFGQLPSVEQQNKVDAKSEISAQDKLDRVDAAIAMLSGEIEANNADAAEMAARKYKANRKQIELNGDGPGRNGSMSISAINESRKRRAIEASLNASSAIKKAIELISENPDSAFKQVLDMESAVTKQFNEGFFGKSAKLDDQLDMAVGSMIGAGSYSGNGSAGRKLRMAAHAYFAPDMSEPAKAQDPATVDVENQQKTNTSQERVKKIEKNEHIEFSRHGDFWIYQGGRVKEVAKALGVTITKRNGNPMVGVPDHALALSVDDLARAGIDARFDGVDATGRKDAATSDKSAVEADSRGSKTQERTVRAVDPAAVDAKKEAETPKVETDKGIALYSKAKDATQSAPITRTEAESSIKSILGDKLGKVLIDSGIVTLVDNVSQLKNLAGAKFMVAWHGSPHDHDKFDSSKIGTGEGAQAYGYGHYFAGAKDVAEWYRRKLSSADNSSVTFNGKQYGDSDAANRKLTNDVNKWAKETGRDVERVDVALEYLAGMGGNLGAARQLAAKEGLGMSHWIYDTLNDLSEYLYPSPNGKLYQVELAPSENEFLDWDKPLSEQSDTVKAALLEWAKVAQKESYAELEKRNKQFPGSVNGIEFIHPDVYSVQEYLDEYAGLEDGGQGFYKMLTDDLGSDKAASDYLHSIGIRGIRYLDGSSRSAGAGNSNYVIFSDDDVSITAKYAKENGGIQGATLPDGRIALVLNNLNADNFAGVFAHEGFHSTIRDLVGEQTYTQMMKRLDTMLAMGKGAQWVKDANAAIPSNTKAEHRTEEIAAYSIEQYINGAKQPNIIKRWVESFLSALRTAIIRHLPNGKLKLWAVKNIQPQDLANLAIAGLKAKAQGQLQAQGREAMAFSKINQTDTPKTINVDGTQAPTSVSDGSTGSAKAPHIAAAEQILSLMDDPVYTYGLRVLPSDFTDPVKLRETIPSSFVWQDGDITDEEINGVSTAGIRRSDLESVLAAMKNLGVTGKNGPNGYYFGSRVVLVRGDSNGSGQDVGETIIRDPEVLGEWKKPNNGLSEVMPNDPSASAGSNPDIRYSKSSNVDDLNAAMLENEGIENAFSLSSLGDKSLIKAFKETFGVDVIPVKANTEQGKQFLGMNYGGKLYVNAENEHAGFVQIAGHELLHQIANDSPGIYKWFSGIATDYLRSGAAEHYGERLKAQGANLDAEATHQEILADFVGDALVDHNFLQALADNNQSKFKMFVGSVIKWLSNVANKLSGKGFESSQYFDDVNGLRGYLVGVLDAYSKTKNIPDSGAIRYSRAQNPTLSHALDLVSNFTGPSAKTFGSMKNVQTQLHKARKDPEHFGKVFNLAMDFRTGVSRSAYRAWEAAKDILPAYDNIADATKAVMHGNKVSKELSRVSSWIFDGTTDGGGNPLDGVRWTPEQLRTEFKATEKEIGLYEQARNAIDSSLIEVANSVAWKIAKPNISEAMADKVKALVTGNAAGAKRIIEASLQFSQNYGTEAEQESTLQAIEAVGKVYEQAQALIDAGYAPLSRFGRYTVDVFEVGADGKIIRDSKGTPSRLLFQKFEFESEAKAADRQLKKEYSGNPNVVIKRGVQAEKTLFSGVDPETVALFVDQVSEIPGLDIKREVLDEWRRNAVSQRSALMHHIKRKGIQGYSEDLPRVLASFLTSNARYASSNFHMADMQKAISDIPDTKGDVRDEAQELFDYINAQNEPGAWMRGLMFAWYLGGSPAAAAVNLTQPVLMTLPYLSQFGSATKHLLSSVRQAMQPKMIPASLKDVMTRATEDGLVEAQEIHHLYDAGMKPIIARIPGGESLRARAQGAATLWGAMFGMAENFNRRITFLSAYKMGQEMGDAKLKEKGFADAYEFAKLAVEETQGIYAKENRPNWARGNGSLGAVGVAAFTFKQFSIQYVELLSRMAKSGPEGKKSALLMLGLLVLASGIQGGPGADDLDDLIDTVLQSMGYVGNVKKAKRDFLKNLAGERIADIVMYGLSVETPIDLQSRLGLGNLFPATGVFKPSENNKAGQLAEIFGPPGGMGKAVGEFVDATQSGQQANAFAALSPVFIRNIAKAMQMAETGEYRDSRGRKVESVDMADAIIKGIGFQPQDVATSSRRAQMVRQDIARVRDVESDIASIWAQGIAEGDKDQVSRARERLADWNASNPQMPIRINMQQIFRRVREMKTERSDRLERTAPRELRGYVRDALN